MALSPAALGDPAFRIETFDELRRAELEIRGILDAQPGGPLAHASWQQAVPIYTSGRYRLVIEDASSDIVAWMTRVRALTTMASTAQLLVAQLTGKSFPVVLTSVTKIEGSSYLGASGNGSHIIGVLGVSGSGLDSSTQIIAFNSAIKGQGPAANMCVAGSSLGSQSGDLVYQAGVVATNRFELKQFGGGIGYRLMYLQKN